jgi:hypothetical protein
VKRKFQMKKKMFLSLLLLATVVAGAFAAADETGTKAHTRRDSVLVSPVEDPTVTNVITNTAIVPNDPRQVLQDYDSLMIALTQKFSATLATIAEAVKRGEVSSEQAREMGAELYNSPTCSLICLACGVESKNRTWRGFRMLKQNRTQRKQTKS